MPFRFSIGLMRRSQILAQCRDSSARKIEPMRVPQEVRVCDNAQRLGVSFKFKKVLRLLFFCTTKFGNDFLSYVCAWKPTCNGKLARMAKRRMPEIVQEPTGL